MPEIATELPTQDEVIDAVLGAGRVLVAIAIRSLAAAEVDVTLQQYRALVILSNSVEQRTVDLASELGVNSSTATRLIDRLVRRKLVDRQVHREDRRATSVSITAAGRDVVASVTRERRAEARRILRKLPAESRRTLVAALDTLCAAAGEAPEQTWSLGWTNA